MGIVRNDRRDNAINLLAEVRIQLRGLLSQGDALQASVEALEVELGLANEGEQAARDQLLVLHYPEGNADGHPLDECTDECAAAEALDIIEPGREKDPE